MPMAQLIGPTVQRIEDGSVFNLETTPGYTAAFPRHVIEDHHASLSDAGKLVPNTKPGRYQPRT